MSSYIANLPNSVNCFYGFQRYFVWQCLDFFVKVSFVNIPKIVDHCLQATARQCRRSCGTKVFYTASFRV